MKEKLRSISSKEKKIKGKQHYLKELIHYKGKEYLITFIPNHCRSSLNNVFSLTSVQKLHCEVSSYPVVVLYVTDFNDYSVEKKVVQSGESQNNSIFCERFLIKKKKHS